MDGKMAQRRPRVTDAQQIQIVRLNIRQVPQTAIAHAVGVHRHTVRRVLERARAALQVNEDTDAERAAAVMVYQEVQRTAWEAIGKGRSPAMLLAEITRAQTRIDALLGLAPAGPDDPALELARFKAIVVSVIQREAPDLAPTIAQRLLESREESGD